MSDFLHVGDVGVRIDFEVNVDINEINKAIVYYKKPDGTKGEWECNIDTDNNLVYYVTQDNDLNLKGIYKLQLYIELDKYKGRADKVELLVKDVL